MPIIAVDIETQTHFKPTYPEDIHPIGKKFGLSVLAPITDIVLYERNQDPIVFSMSDWDPWLQQRGDENKWRIIKEKLCQPDVLIVGHNVVFDLRHIIAHYNYWYPDDSFHIPLGAKVWDTLVIAQRMLLGEQRSARSAFGDSFGLAGGRDKKDKPYFGISERFGLLEPLSDFWEFYVWMKSQRDNLSNLHETLATLDEDHTVWKFLGGWVPSNRPDLLTTAADKLRTEYVIRDAILAYELYEKEKQIAEHLATNEFVHQHLRIARWPELTQRDIHNGFQSLLDFWTRRLRLNANRAGRGLRVNQQYITERKKIASDIVKSRSKVVLEKRDKHDPYPNFERVFSMLMYYKMVLDVINKDTACNDPKLWAFWRPIEISPITLDDALSDVPGKMQWMDWLVEERHTSKKQIKLSAPSNEAPDIDLVDWVRRNCYIGYEEPLASFLAQVKTNWLLYYYKTREASLRDKARKHLEKKGQEEPNEDKQLELGIKLFQKGFISSRIWVPFYVYCVATAPLPTSDEFKYMAELTTPKFKTELSKYRRLFDEEPSDFQKFAIEKNGLSYGKKAMQYFIESPTYDTPDLAPLRELMQARADLQKFKEIELHAKFDGAVHSIIINDTKTGRASSNNPNLQNIKMSSKPGEPDTPFPGTFQAPEGMWLCELDYSNAEVRMGNMIAADNAAAAAAEGHDFHSAMAMVYATPEVWATYDPATKKQWRNEYKKVTFGGGYGAGDYKLSLMLKTTMERVHEITNNKKRAFWKTEEQKKIVSDNAKKRMAAGYVPVFVQLWSKERVQVDRVKYGQKIDCVAYTGWNSLQQGGVTSMISRADVLISEMLEREGYKTFVQQDVHDALIIAFDIQEYLANNRALPQRIMQIMGSIMPDEYCERTTPKTHFVTALGPENTKKWGCHPHLTYPFPTDEFINQWGVFPILPEHKNEAPTWIGPEHEGWTLEKETEFLTKRKQLQAELDKTDGTVAAFSEGDMWIEMQLLLASLPQQTAETLRLQQPIALVTKNAKGHLQHHGHYSFAGWMTAGRVLFHNGHSHVYQDMIKKLQQIIANCPDHFSAWQQKYSTILESV